jgi:hypothetical protein
MVRVRLGVGKAQRLDHQRPYKLKDRVFDDEVVEACLPLRAEDLLQVAVEHRLENSVLVKVPVLLGDAALLERIQPHFALSDDAQNRLEQTVGLGESDELEQA